MNLLERLCKWYLERRGWKVETEFYITWLEAQGGIDTYDPHDGTLWEGCVGTFYGFRVF